LAFSSKSYGQKAGVSLELLDNSSSNSSDFIFRIHIANDSFFALWVQDSTILQGRIPFRGQSLVHIFIDKKINGTYEAYDEGKHRPAIFMEDRWGDSCCNCIILKKGDSVSVDLKILECCSMDFGRLPGGNRD
jgi:hypothetical protein